ncbi:ATP synthase F1 subunit delta [Mycoplasmoides pirum]|uniref:ATP synthase F1 subunit delta n=1 Tax=Mycoplasmoides pirum TaxID=2122 RepID=UPI00048150EE|nr:ATP synthase F1 subunit delta [Mycoplasmoides pirum]
MNKIYNFAKALYSLAEEKNLIKKIYVESQQFLQVVNEYSELIKFFSNSSLNKSEKFSILESTFRNRFDDLFCDFLCVLIEMNEFFYAKSIFKKYLALVENKDHAKFIKITSPYPLKDAQLNKIKEILEKKMDFDLIVKNFVDPSTIAGIKVESDSHSLDSTIKGKLKTIETRLKVMLTLQQSQSPKTS